MVKGDKVNMKVVLLAGGYGTRISEESHLKPKPMIEIGGKPILWHIMKHYSSFGHNEFIICAGYKQNVIKEFFANYFLYNSNITFDFSNGNQMTINEHNNEPWKVTVIDTGLNTMTGGRLKRIKKYLGDESFFLTYGDGVSNVNLDHLLSYHKNHGKLVTITAIQPEGRFGILDIDDENKILAFREKNKNDVGWINGGFMVIEPSFIDFIAGDDIVLEQQPMEKTVQLEQLIAFKHRGYWQNMDTLRDKQKLEFLWENGNPPWKVWE